MLPALCVALLKSLERPNTKPEPAIESPLSNPILWGLAFQFSAIIYMLVAPLVGGGSMHMSQSPWPAIIGATLVTSTTALMARTTGLHSRLVSIALWSAFTLLIFGLIGPGEGWLAS